MKIVRIIDVVDTRTYEEQADGKFHPIPGSGQLHNCARCGREHEVHAYIGLEDGSEIVVGTGCMTAEDSAAAVRLQRAANAAKRLRGLLAEKAAFDAKVAEWDTAWQAVCALPLPEWQIVNTTTKYGEPRPLQLLVIGDSNVTVVDQYSYDRWTGKLNNERVNCAIQDWRERRLAERLIGWRHHYRPYPYRDYAKLIRNAEAALHREIA